MSGKRSTRGTFVMVKHANQKRNDLSKLTKRTLGSGNLKEAVKLPKNESLNEWIATHCVDFYNEVCVLYELSAEDAKKFTQPGEGFPPNFEYRWADGKSSKPIRCSSPEYVEYVLNWIEEQIQDESLFPVADDAKFPPEFMSVANKILTRIMRVYAILYHSFFGVFEGAGAASHLNTSFKHFVFFVHHHALLEEKEYKALQEPVKRLIEQYEKN